MVSQPLVPKSDFESNFNLKGHFPSSAATVLTASTWYILLSNSSLYNVPGSTLYPKMMCGTRLLPVYILNEVQVASIPNPEAHQDIQPHQSFLDISQ